MESNNNAVRVKSTEEITISRRGGVEREERVMFDNLIALEVEG
jgi:hypothetical protein